MSLQIYGHFSDVGSFAEVSRRFAHAFYKRYKATTVYEIATHNPSYVGVHAPIGLNSPAPVGLCIGYPPQGVGWLKGHDQRILVTVCEADPIPKGWVSACNETTLVVVPSLFCKNVFQRAGVRVPIEVVPHGVDPHYHPSQRLPRSEMTNYRLLHVSGAASFPQRKGTPQLLLAIREMMKHYKGFKVYLKMADSIELRSAIYTLGIGNHVHVLGKPLTPGAMFKVFNEMDAVIQPSRGEGFGMVPLEARCLGIPAILTPTTGHMMHVAECDISIATGELKPLATQGNEVGLCPTVSVEAVHHALAAYLRQPWSHRVLAERWAKENAERWTWDRVLSPFVHKVRKVLPWLTTNTIRSGEEASVRGYG